MSDAPCGHDKRFTGVFDMPKGTHGCVACGFEQKCAEVERLRGVLDARPPYYCPQCPCGRCGNSVALTQPDMAEYLRSCPRCGQRMSSSIHKASACAALAGEKP
jgi:hypothetical protein